MLLFSGGCRFAPALQRQRCHDRQLALSRERHASPAAPLSVALPPTSRFVVPSTHRFDWELKEGGCADVCVCVLARSCACLAAGVSTYGPQEPCGMINNVNILQTALSSSDVVALGVLPSCPLCPPSRARMRTRGQVSVLSSLPVSAAYFHHRPGLALATVHIRPIGAQSGVRPHGAQLRRRAAAHSRRDGAHVLPATCRPADLPICRYVT